MQRYVVVSALNKIPAYFLLFIFLLITFAMLYQDGIGKGLNKTLAYKFIGIAIYPIFYIFAFYIIISIIIIIKNANNYLVISGESLVIGGLKSVRLDDVCEIEVTGIWPLQSIRLNRQNSQSTYIKIYMIEEKSVDVIQSIKKYTGPTL